MIGIGCQSKLTLFLCQVQTEIFPPLILLLLIMVFVLQDTSNFKNKTRLPKLRMWLKITVCELQWIYIFVLFIEFTACASSSWSVWLFLWWRFLPSISCKFYICCTQNFSLIFMQIMSIFSVLVAFVMNSCSKLLIYFCLLLFIVFTTEWPVGFIDSS